VTRRPGSIVLISIWLGIFFFIFYFNPIVRTLSGYTGHHRTPNALFTIVFFVGMVLVIAFLVRLAQLRASYIWVSMVLAGGWAAWMTIRLTLLAPPDLYLPSVTKASVVVAITLNGASAW
jgi:hypothetical protein